MYSMVNELLRVADIIAERTTPAEKLDMKRYYKKNHVKILKEEKTENRTVPYTRREQRGGITHSPRKKYRKQKDPNLNL